MGEKNEFKGSCRDLEPDFVVQKYLIDGSCFFFDFINNGGEFEFKKDIASSLGVHLRDIAIVGSGKLGFSIKPNENVQEFYEFKDFDHDFNKDPENEKSDLDVAIISSALFDHQLIKLYAHTEAYNKFVSNNKSMKNSFATYILKGWLRPDKVPSDYSINSDVIKVQDSYKMQFGRTVNIGIYKSWYFFESYHRNNIHKIKLNLIANS